MKKFEGGITLIALVITIIVLLILAGVSIAMLTGDNGILTQANNAKTETEKAEAKERIQLEVLGSYGTNGELDINELKSNLTKNVPGVTVGSETELPLTVTVGDYTFTVKANGTVEEPVNPDPPTGDEIVTEAPTAEKVTKNTKYQDAASNNKIAVIPVGFAVVPGCTKIDDGLVISDVANDEENIGNQFVWIPVNESNIFTRREGYSDDGVNIENIDNYGEADSTGINDKVEETLKTQAEAKAMYQSVSHNGGFYIGRFEAGNEDGEVVTKKGVSVYNQIGWNNDTTDFSITNEDGGAVELARNFASIHGYDTTKVHSTLCYSVQWDTALNFMDPGYVGYAKDKTKGNYSGTLNDTGINDEYSLKNIYDMAGNVFEWTMESYSNSERTIRGGAIQMREFLRYSFYEKITRGYEWWKLGWF